MWIDPQAQAQQFAAQAQMRQQTRDLHTLAQQQQQPVAAAPAQYNNVTPANNHSGVNSVVSAVEWAVIGYTIGHLLGKFPWFRLVVAALLAYIGIALTVQGAPWGLLFVGLAGLLVWWGAVHPGRVRAAADARFATLSSPEAVERVMVDSVVTQGPAIGWAIKVAQVVPNTFRAAQGQVWADVDLILADGNALAASFHADTAADAWTWAARS